MTTFIIFGYGVCLGSIIITVIQLSIYKKTKLKLDRCKHQWDQYKYRLDLILIKLDNRYWQGRLKKDRYCYYHNMIYKAANKKLDQIYKN